MMDTARRPALSSLLVRAAVILFIGIRAELLPAGIPPPSVSSPFLYSVDVLLEGSADKPLPLGIRRGQTAVQAAESFCVEQGLDQKMQVVLMPQLIQVLEAGMATSSVGHNAPAEYDTAAVPTQGPGNRFERMNRGVGPIKHPKANDDPTITLEVSLDGGATHTLYYYAGQDPNDIASKFCAESLDSSSAPEAFARCSELLSAGIIERLLPLDASSDQGYEMDGSKERRETAAPWLVVPLNVDGLETTLQIHRGSIPEDLAGEFCRREEVAFNGATFDSCFSQIIQIARRAITAQTSREKDGMIKRRGGARPYTFNIPVTLSGVEVLAEFRTDETPRESALRFCVPNLPSIESALGTIGNSGGIDDSNGLDQRVKEEEREALLGTCAMIVEDAINAVLLGLRERVLEAEMALSMATGPMTDE